MLVVWPVFNLIFGRPVLMVRLGYWNHCVWHGICGVWFLNVVMRWLWRPVFFVYWWMNYARPAVDSVHYFHFLFYDVVYFSMFVLVDGWLNLLLNFLGGYYYSLFREQFFCEEDPIRYFLLYNWFVILMY